MTETKGIMEKNIRENKEDTFWNNDLNVIEKKFLGHRNISELPVYTNDAVPYRGSVLFDNVVYKEIPPPNAILRIYARLDRFLNS